MPTAIVNARDPAWGGTGGIGTSVFSPQGADPTGVLDSTAAIQNAINAAAGAGGGIVYVAEGTYKITSPLSVPNFVNIEGAGQSTLFRAFGNFYVFNLNPANRTAFSSFTVDASTVQASGGGFDFTNAGNNVALSNIYFGSNLFISLNIAPTGPFGIYVFDWIRWNGVTGCNTAINVGDGSHIVNDVHMHHIVGTAATIADMANWIVLKKGTDTFHMNDSLFYSGSKGLTCGATGSATDVTNCKLTGVIFDNQDLQGIDIQSCRGFHFANCAVQGNGTTALPGMKIDANAKAVTWVGGWIHECRSDGVSINVGAKDVNFVGAQILNNNTSNQTFGSGVTITAGASDFSFVGCSIGNNMVGITATQKYGILMGGGASTNFVIAHNRFPGNVTQAFEVNGATGANQVVEGNIPNQIPTVASAATITLPGAPMVIVSGVVNVTSITAAQAGRIVTLQVAGALTITDGGNLKLAGNFVGNAAGDPDTLTLQSDGTNWFEMSRSLN